MTKGQKARLAEDILDNLIGYDIGDIEDPEELIFNCIDYVEKQGFGMEGNEIEDWDFFENCVWKKVKKELEID